MTRYRRFETGTWADSRFMELSPAPPNAQTLWIYLLAGPRTTVFPGVIIARPAVMASDLGWPLYGQLDSRVPNGCGCLMDAWLEIEGRGMAKADWKAGVIVLPRALLDRRGSPRESSRPTSPNAFRGWGKSWPEIPQCELTTNYLEILRKFAGQLDAINAPIPPELRLNYRKNRGRPRKEKPSKVSYLAVFDEVFSTRLERVGDESASDTPTSQRPTRVPVPVPVSGYRISSGAEAESGSSGGHGSTFEIAHSGSGSGARELPESGPARSSASPPPGGFPKAKSQPYPGTVPVLSPDRTPGRGTPGGGPSPGVAGPESGQAGPIREPKVWPKASGRVDRPEPRSPVGSAASTRTHSGKSQGEQTRPVSASSGPLPEAEQAALREIAAAAGLRTAPAPRVYGALPGPTAHAPPSAPGADTAPEYGGDDGAA